MDYLTRVDGDLYDITHRIKEIDPTYTIYLNNKTHKFEVFGGRNMEKQCTLPFDRLDARTVVYLQKTRKERLDEIIREIEEENNNLELVARKEASNNLNANLKEAVDKAIYEEAN